MRKSCAPYVQKIAEILSNRYRDFNHYNRKNPLDELLFILCSVKRSEIVYLRAFRSLKQAFPRFEDLAKASKKELVSKVSWGGLQNQKAASVNPKNAVKKDAPVESSLIRHCRDYSYQS